MALRRRELLILGGVGTAAAVAGALLGPLALQSGSGAAGLLSTIFPDLDGQARRLLDWKGRVTVTNFWATWCAPCLEEIPLLVSLREKYRSRGVEILGIGIDHPTKIREFAANYRISYPLLIGDARALEVMRQLGNQAGVLPYTVVLDRSGAIVHRKLGAFQEGELDGILAPLLQ